MFYLFLYYRLQLLFELSWKLKLNNEAVTLCKDKPLEKDEGHIMQ